jgi:hypothetical protein
VKILFVMRSTVYVRNFESTLRLLAQRGHRVHLAAPPHRTLDDDLVERLCRDCEGITAGPPPAREPYGWSLLGEAVRQGIDYLRYLGPEYAEAPKLRARALRTAPPFVTRLLAWPGVRSAGGRTLLTRVLRSVDRHLPQDPQVTRYIREQAPDLVLVTPLVEPGSPQSEYLRSARALGIRTGLCVHSWDNLTNKGLIHDPLDVVTVWNDAMKREAIEQHSVPEDCIAVTGAAAYDQWFTWKPATDRAIFLRMVGLPVDRPYLFYVCSSKFIAPDEPPFIRKWITELRRLSDVLHRTSVLVRPHPQNADAWKATDLGDLEGVSVWPAAGRNPVDADSRAEYFDSMYHSAAVVGVNTSAQIEAGIVGREVFTVLTDEFRDAQEGTPHFQHLKQVNGGLLTVARDFREHAAQLERQVQSGADGERATFVQAFVRPWGLTQPATPRMVQALEAAAVRPHVETPRAGVLAAIVRNGLRGVAELYERAERKRRAKQSKRAAMSKAQAVAARRAAHDQDHERTRIERLARRQAGDKRRASAEAKRRTARAEEAARGYENYRIVREHVRRMRAASVSCVRSAAERQMLDAMAHLWDASPAVVAELRRHAEPVTGCGAGLYASGGEARKQFFFDQNRLVKGGNPALLLPESPMLGGFGYAAETPEGERLFNDDTLKYCEVLSALECGAVLDAFRKPGAKPIVWEPGGGWGGLIYQIKTLFPAATCVITAPPELLLLSATYLLTAFPGARCRFHDEVSGGAFWRDLGSCDFACGPEEAIEHIPDDGRLDLTLDVQRLEWLPGERGAAEVVAAHRLGSRYVYSLGPRDADTDGMQSAADALARHFWMYELPVPRYQGMRVLTGFRKPGDGIDRVHRLGWRRLAL